METFLFTFAVIYTYVTMLLDPTIYSSDSKFTLEVFTVYAYLYPLLHLLVMKNTSPNRNSSKHFSKIVVLVQARRAAMFREDHLG